MIRRLTSSFLLGFMMFVFFVPSIARAGEQSSGRGLGEAETFVSGAAKGAGFETDPSKTATPLSIAGSLVNTFLSLIGIIFIILIIFAGFKWMTAGGNEEQVKKATTTIINSVIGIVVVMGAFILYKFIEGIL